MGIRTSRTATMMLVWLVSLGLGHGVGSAEETPQPFTQGPHDKAQPAGHSEARIVLGQASPPAVSTGGVPGYTPDKQAPPAMLAFSQDPDTVVAQLTRQIGSIADEDRTPFIRVYGDGRVVVHYPIYMKKAGDYVLQLSEKELASLLALLVEKGVIDFDKKGALAEKEAAQKAMEKGRTVFHERADETTTIIETTVLVSSKSGADPKLVETKASWYGLKHDAERFPEIVSLSNLAAAEAALAALAERPELKKTQE